MNSPPVAVADRVMTAVYEGRPVDPGDAATLAVWVQEAAVTCEDVQVEGTAVMS